MWGRKRAVHGARRIPNFARSSLDTGKLSNFCDKRRALALDSAQCSSTGNFLRIALNLTLETPRCISTQLSRIHYSKNPRVGTVRIKCRSFKIVTIKNLLQGNCINLYFLHLLDCCELERSLKEIESKFIEHK